VSTTNSSHTWKIVVSVVLAGVLFGYFLWRAPLAEVGLALAHVNPWWAGAALLAAASTYILRALRWGLILRPVGKAPAGKLIGATAAGFATSTLLPARAGEVVRPLLLSAQTGLPAAATLASILTERLFDGASILVLFAAGVLGTGKELGATHLPLLQRAALLTTASLVVATVLAVFLLRRRDLTVRLLTRPLPARFRARGETFLHHVLDGLEVLRNPLRLLEIVAWSLGMWLIIAWQVVLLARAFAISLTLYQSFIVIAVSVIGLAVPTPAGVGGFHAAIQFALTQLLGVEIATATAFALLHHAICFFPVTVAGLAYLATVGLSLSRVRNLQPDAAAPPEES
jgi:glycosyltransferase 2 family protein